MGEDEIPLSEKNEEKEIGPPAPIGGCLPKNSELFQNMVNPSQPPQENMEEVNEMDELWNEIMEEPPAPSGPSAPKPPLTGEEEVRRKVAAKRLAALARRENLRKEREAAAVEAASAL